MTGAEVSPPDPRRLISAWCVHLFTASGAVLGVVALVAISRDAFGAASLMMLAALLIDSVDGTLARRVGVATVLPRIDGRRLDDIVDYLTFVIVPVVFLLQLGALPHWGFAVAPVVASAYGFSQQDAKTEDDFFLGWPSYWNVVAIYTWLLDVGPVAATLWVTGFSIAVFVPLKYIYPSKLRSLRGTTVVLALAWGAALTAAIAEPDALHARELVWISLLFPAYYMALSAWLGGWMRRAS